MDVHFLVEGIPDNTGALLDINGLLRMQRSEDAAPDDDARNVDRAGNAACAIHHNRTGSVIVAGNIAEDIPLDT